MAHVNDVNDLSGRLERVISKIDTADIAEADRDALREYATWKRRRADSMNTARIYISAVLHSAERFDRPIVDVDSAGPVEDIISAHENAGCTAAKSINSKLDGLRDFWRWYHGPGPGDGDARWVDLVKNVKASAENPGTEPLDPESVLKEPEITALREHATNYRDKALIAFLCDTGARITLALQMLRGDINLGRNPPTFRPNPQGVGHKDVATKEFVLHESTRHLRIYLNEAHPEADDDAPLFALRRGYDADDRENGAMSPRTARRALTRAAEAAGLDVERARPHNLRKSAVVRMRMKHNMGWDAIQKRMEWSDSALPKMKEVYRAIENEDEIEMVARELGYDDDAATEADVDRDCWNCGASVEPADTYCAACGMNLDAEAADEGVPVTREEFEGLVAAVVQLADGADRPDLSDDVKRETVGAVTAAAEGNNTPVEAVSQRLGLADDE